MPEARHGLSTEDLSLLDKVFSRFPGVQSVVLFGSRAKGTHRAGSDVDLALKGDIGRERLVEISHHLNEETLLPYRFDLVAYDSIENVALLEHIDRIGFELHTKRTETHTL
jgi:predicted nucleotidyltransferase